MHQFQSAHPRGMRSKQTLVCLRQRGFNPRTRVGCDVRLVHYNIGRVVSIRAPAWDAMTEISPYMPIGLFQSAHPRGMRYRHLNESCSYTMFQSAHPRGMRWQHIVRFARSKHLSLHFAHKIDAILGIRSHSRILASVLSERKRVNFMLTWGSHSNFPLASFAILVLRL